LREELKKKTKQIEYLNKDKEDSNTTHRMWEERNKELNRELDKLRDTQSVSKNKRDKIFKESANGVKYIK